jgi:MinD superfamily P-loop ATPase
MERVLATAAHFRVPALVCINKADIYPEGTARIEAYCKSAGIEVAGRVPFDTAVTEAMVHGEPVTAYEPASPAAQALAGLWQHVAGRLCPDRHAGSVV